MDYGRFGTWVGVASGLAFVTAPLLGPFASLLGPFALLAGLGGAALASRFLRNDVFVNYQQERSKYRAAAPTTEELLAKEPEGAEDPAVLPHILKAIAGDRPVSFSRGQGAGSNEASQQKLLTDSSQGDVRWRMTLSSLPSWSQSSSVEDVLGDDEAKGAFAEEVRLRIAARLNIDPSAVEVTDIIRGSVVIPFTIKTDELSEEQLQALRDDNMLETLKQDFRTLTDLEVIEGFLGLRFDLDEIDDRGHKLFDNGEDWLVGPKGSERPYHQPSEPWVRFGLKVLGKYADGNHWLEPFQHDKNWFRAFHGTGRSGNSVAAVTSIFRSEFTPSKDGKGGAGIYMSPFIEYCEKNDYCGIVVTEMGKKFIFVIQAAVCPDGIVKELVQCKHTGENQEWVCATGCVRPYGILVKQVRT